MMTGDALMLSAETFGSTVCGSPALATPSLTAAVASLTFVPYSNWATTRASEFADVDWTVTRRGTPETACSIGLATWLATSLAPAPGNGAMIVMTGKSMSGRSSCLRLPQAEIPATNRAKASSSVTLRLRTARALSRLTGSSLRRSGSERGRRRRDRSRR